MGVASHAAENAAGFYRVVASTNIRISVTMHAFISVFKAINAVAAAFL